MDLLNGMAKNVERHLLVAKQSEWGSHLTYHLRLLLSVHLKHLPNQFNGPTSFIENILQYSSPYRILLKHQKISARLQCYIPEDNAHTHHHDGH